MQKKLAVFFVILSVLLAGCGLDTFYYLDEPSSVYSCQADQSDEAKLYVSFLTSEQTQNNSIYISGTAGFSFLGTAVYYCIYDNTSALSSFTTTINSLNSSSTYSSAAERIISSGYRPLNITTGGAPNPLVVQQGTNRNLYIRLTSLESQDAFQSAIRVGTSSISQSTEGADLFSGAKPCRSNENLFDFSKIDVDLPLASDDDTRFSSTEAPNTYYVDLYAFSVGQDTTFARSYSNAVHLGTIPISISD